MTSLVAASSSSQAAAASADEDSSQSYTTPDRPSSGEALKQRHATDDTASDASGAGGSYEVIEYDLNDRDHHHHRFGTKKNSNNDNSQYSSNLLYVGDAQLHIEDNSPAAAALRANANVEVSRVGKAARAVHMQTVRKIVKRATMTSKSGVVRGKPPRLPPTIQESTTNAFLDHSYSAAAAATGGALDRIDEMDAAEYNEKQQQQHRLQQESVTTDSIPPQDDHIPDGVVRGTAEAGNKGESMSCYEQNALLNTTHNTYYLTQNDTSLLLHNTCSTRPSR